MTVRADSSSKLLAERVAAAHEQAQLTLERLAAISARLRDTQQLVRQARQRRTATHDAAFVRLTTRLESQSLIEQAKGVLVAQTGCDPDEALGLLRSASRGSGISVQELAASIVRAARAGTDGLAGR